MTENHTATNIRIAVFDSPDATEPTTVFRTHNTTRDLYHEAVVGELNGVAADLQIDALALGDSTVATTNLNDSQLLGNETFRTDTIDTDRSGQTFTASIFIDSTEGNGQTFEEGALTAVQPDGSDLPINRFLISDPGGLLSPKSQGESVTIDVEITQTDA